MRRPECRLPHFSKSEWLRQAREVGSLRTTLLSVYAKGWISLVSKERRKKLLYSGETYSINELFPSKGLNRVYVKEL